MFENISTVRELLFTISEQYGQRPLFSYMEDGKARSVSYADFAGQVNAAAKSLIRRGITGRHVSIVSENSYEAILWAYAVPLSGNVLIMLDNMATLQEKAHLAAHSDTTCLIYSTSNQPFCDHLKESGQSVSHAICIETETEEYLNTVPDVSLPDTDGRELAYIFYSSGTTSRPKGIMQSQINLLRSAFYFTRSADLKGTVYLMLPISHILTFANVALASMLSGASVFISTGLKHIWTDMREAKPYCIFAVPAVMAFFDRTIHAAARDIHRADPAIGSLSARKTALRRLFGENLAHFTIGGAPINLDVANHLQELGVQVLNGYGLTETCGSITVNPRNDNRLGSIGRVNAGSEVKVMDGELAFKNPYLFLGYYKDEEATRESFDGEWFLSGDLGHVEDGYVYITGRKKNLIVLPNGKKICPEELEQEALGIEEIKEVVICEQDGRLTAKIYSEHDEEVIRRKINELNKRLSSYKQIANIIFYTEEFPKTSSKKIKRGEI